MVKKASPNLDALIAGVKAENIQKATWVGNAVLYLLKKEKTKQ